MITENITFISVSIIMIIYVVFALYLFLSGDEKRKTFGGWLIFGIFWPLLRGRSNKNLNQKEKIGFYILFLFMLGAVIVTYFLTDGTFRV